MGNCYVCGRPRHRTVECRSSSSTPNAYTSQLLLHNPQCRALQPNSKPRSQACKIRVNLKAVDSHHHPKRTSMLNRQLYHKTITSHTSFKLRLTCNHRNCQHLNIIRQRTALLRLTCPHTSHINRHQLERNLQLFTIYPLNSMSLRHLLTQACFSTRHRLRLT